MRNYDLKPNDLSNYILQTSIYLDDFANLIDNTLEVPKDMSEDTPEKVLIARLIYEGYKLIDNEYLGRILYHLEKSNNFKLIISFQNKFEDAILSMELEKNDKTNLPIKYLTKLRELICKEFNTSISKIKK